MPATVVFAAVTDLAVTGVRSVTRLQFGLLVFGYAVLLVFCTWALVTGRQEFSLSWLKPRYRRAMPVISN